MRNDHVTTWAPSTWCHVDPPNGSGPWGTQVLTLGCPVDFEAVRVAFINVLSAPFLVEQVIATSSSSWNDMINPVSNRGWQEFARSAPSGHPGGGLVQKKQIEVQGAETPGAQIPQWTWTDWLPVASADPDPTTGMRVLMLRYRLARQHITYVVGQFREWSHDSEFTHGFRYFVGGYNNGLDSVSEPGTLDWKTARLNSLFNGSLIAAVQFKIRTKAIVGCIAGDSHFEGTSTTSQFFNAVSQLTIQRGSSRVGTAAYGYINAARGGTTSAEFLARAVMAVDEIHPDYIVLPSWSFNDHLGEVNSEEVVNGYFSQLMDFIRKCRTSGVLPILVSPIPRDWQSMTANRMRGWRVAYELGRDLAAEGVPFVDVSRLFSESDRGGLLATWPSGSPFTNDHAHPNDLGHGLLSNFIQRVLSEKLSGF